MKKYMVSLDVVTAPETTGRQVADYLGVEESALTHRQISVGTLWAYEPVVDDSMPLVELINQTMSRVDVKPGTACEQQIRNVYLDIAARYDTAYCSVSLPAQCLDLLRAKIPCADVEVTCYPVGEPEEGERSADSVPGA